MRVNVLGTIKYMINPKISLLLVLSQIKISDFQTRFTMSCFFALLTPARHAVKVENRSGRTFCVCIVRHFQLSSG